MPLPAVVRVQDRAPYSWLRVAWGWLSLLYSVFTIPFIMRDLRAVQPLYLRKGQSEELLDGTSVGSGDCGTNRDCSTSGLFCGL